MQLRAFLFLSFLGFVFSTAAHDYTGVWEGSFYLRSKKHKINVRIEIVQQGNWVRGVISTRGFEKNTAYGCDYMVDGWFEKNSLVLGLQNVRRAVAMSEHDCISFKQIELALNLKDSTNTAKGKWFWLDESKEVFIVKKMGADVSEIAKEEIDAHTGNPVTKEIDQLKLNGREVTITVRSVVKDPKGLLCAWLNGKPLATNLNLAKNGLLIKLDDIAPANRFVFLNNSITGERIDVKITFQQGNKTKEWITSIDASGKVLLVLTYKKDDVLPDRFPDFVSDHL